MMLSRAVSGVVVAAVGDVVVVVVVFIVFFGLCGCPVFLLVGLN
jgi:hypothetical protein